MNKWILLSLVFVFGYVGMGWLALSLKSHWQQLNTAIELTPRRIWVHRLLGTFFLSVSLVFCFMADKPSIAILVWVMSMTLMAKAVAFTLSYRVTWLRPVVVLLIKPR